MRKKIFTAAVAFTAIAGLLAFNVQQSSISGKISPGDGAETVWAISQVDSVKAGISAGTFSLPVKSGTYKVIIDAKDPYKDVLLENVVVKDGMPTDVGEIVLQK